MRHPHPIPKEKLKNLSTDRLLRVLKLARQEYIYLGRSDRFMSEELLGAALAKVEAYLADLKEILSTREHRQ